MAALIFLGLGLLCAVIGRILLIGAAFGVSVWWALGIFLPFGPTFFRLSYPDLAPASRYFRLAVLPCVLVFFILEPHGLSKLRDFDILKSAQEQAAPADHYALEKVARRNRTQRLAANEREFQRLNAWKEALRLRKRDLLNSDDQGNIRYDAELAQYNEALEKANAEKKALFSSSR